MRARAGNHVARALAAVLLGFVSTESASAIESEAPRALVIEAGNGAVLYEKASEEPFEAGNFAKLVTALVVFAALDEGTIRSTDLLPISEHAWRTGGAPAGTTTMFAEVNSSVAVDDLVSGLIVHYANDAAIVLAENIAGDEHAFAAKMNDIAAQWGLGASHFGDPTGLDPALSSTTLADLARLMRRLLRDDPRRFARYATPEFEWNGILQLNKTEFIRSIRGVEGMMLAHTESAGFGAAISAVRSGRRILVLVSGLPTARAREAEVEHLLDAALAEFATVAIAEAGEPLGTVRVFGGTVPDVSVAGAEAIRATLPVADRSSVVGEIVYDGPVVAPLAAGEVVARLEISAGGHLLQSVPLVALQAVEGGSIPDRAGDALYELVLGWW